MYPKADNVENQLFLCSVVMKIRNEITVEPANDLKFSILEATEEASFCMLRLKFLVSLCSGMDKPK